MEQDIRLGDIVVLKKGHPCGENKWQIVRFGADCKIKCLGCGRIVLIDRPTLKKKIKKVIERQNEESAG
ncbi:MAG: DUF951 domain-containing protein [Candidatus Izemoplasmatales bacterium]|jgi:hypothetical protein|nr:DUF951 domain-containing protein [Candidatus Izemoplasmatales bacterium]